jgi:hypothetical protein
MFGDWGWRSERSDAQEARLHAWLRQVARPLVIEIGAGTTSRPHAGWANACKGR